MTLGRPSRVFPQRWRLRLIRRARVTRWALIMAVFVMLALQSTLAAYACTMLPAQMGPAMAMPSTMDHNCPEMHGASGLGLCAEHCASASTTAPAARPLAVPVSPLAALPAAPPKLAFESPRAQPSAIIDRLQTAPPPPILLFCSLLI